MTDETSPPPPPPGGGSYPPPPPSSGGSAPPPPGPALSTESYTPWVTRALGFIIDNIPVAIVYGIGWVIAAVTTSWTASYGYKVCTTSGIGALAMWLAYLVILAYVVWNNGYRQGMTGSSIGKSV